jgi:hypothetical protein
MWNEKFKGKIAQAVRDGKLKVGRIGGLLTISKTTSGELDEDLIKILQDPEEIAKSFGLKDVKHKIGYAVIDVPEILLDKNKGFVEEKKSALRQTIEKVFNLPTENWLDKTFNRIFNDKKEYSEFIKALEKSDVINSDIITMISEAYFNSPKRAKNRIPTAMKILSNFKEKFPDKFGQVSESLNKILKRYSAVATNKSSEIKESTEVFNPTTVDRLKQKLIEYGIWDKRMKKDDGNHIVWDDKRVQKLLVDIASGKIELNLVSYKKGEGEEVIKRLESKILRPDDSVMFSQGNYSQDYPGLWYDFGSIELQ